MEEWNFINTEFDQMLPETGEKQIEIFEMYWIRTAPKQC